MAQKSNGAKAAPVAGTTTDTNGVSILYLTVGQIWVWQEIEVLVGWDISAMWERHWIGENRTLRWECTNFRWRCAYSWDLDMTRDDRSAS